MITATHSRPRLRRRFVSIALAATAVATALVGCSGGGGDADSSGALTMQVWGSTKGQEGLFRAYQEAYPDDAEGISLKVTSAGDGDGAALQKLRLQLSSGKNIPDIIQLNYSELAEFAEAGVLADLSESIEPYLPNMTDAAKTLSAYKGTNYAVPLSANERLWFYRKDLFDAAGIDPTTVKTSDDFFAAGEKLQASSPDSYIMNMGAKSGGAQLGMIVSGNGASWSQESPCTITVGSDQPTADTFTALKELHESDVVAGDIDDFTPEWQAGFANGTIASYLGASWLSEFVAQYAPDQSGQWSVAQWPEIAGSQGGSEAGGAIFAVMKASKNQDAAADFLEKTLMTADGVGAFIDTKTYPGYMPQVKEMLSDPRVTNDPFYGSTLATAYLEATSTFQVFPFDPAAIKEITTLQTQLANYMTSDSDDPTPFLAEAQASLSSQIGCPFEQ